MKKAELIFVPFPAPTHLVSTIEFAKLLLDRDDRLFVTILLMKLSGFLVDDITQSLTESRIQLVHLPQVDPPPPDLLQKSFEAYFAAYVEFHIPQVRNIVSDIVSSRSDSDSDSARIVGLVVDAFCVSMIDVSKELDLPSYIFLTSNAGFLGLMLYLPSRHSEMSSEFHESDPELLIPGFVIPVPPRVLPEALFNKQGGHAAYIKLAQKFREAKGIIVNSFAELEESMLSSFGDGRNPPVYLVGPVLQPKGAPNPDLDLVQGEKMMKWLDDQPDSSVVFLCFGTAGSFGVPQLKEMALGLELSGLRFLWSLGLPRPNNEDPRSAHYTKPEDMLPDGFLGRVQGKGMICGWAPQMEVLAHKAIGGFVSHCGWNSILESLWNGVPIATWPLYAEQQLNAFRMVRELGLAVASGKDYWGNGELVLADQMEKALTGLMSGDNEAMRNVKRMSEMARIAVMDGGSSFNSVGLLIKEILAPFNH